jgi:hypothetical protein
LQYRPSSHTSTVGIIAELATTVTLAVTLPVGVAIAIIIIIWIALTVDPITDIRVGRAAVNGGACLTNISRLVAGLTGRTRFRSCLAISRTTSLGSVAIQSVIALAVVSTATTSTIGIIAELATTVTLAVTLPIGIAIAIIIIIWIALTVDPIADIRVGRAAVNGGAALAAIGRLIAGLAG